MIKIPRLSLCLLVSLLLMVVAYLFREAEPLVSVSLYKAHLMSLGGWGGYWLDRVAFPYGRPHTLHQDTEDENEDEEISISYGFACIRRAIIIAASLICVGIGA